MKIFKMLLMAGLTIISVSVFAQDNTKPITKTTKQETEKENYNCPMHPGEVSSNPGKCSQCGMNLTKSKKERMKIDVIYTCPMHPDITSNKPGNCSKCNMELKETGNTTIRYACPMHPEVTANSPGKCPKCGMKLTPSSKEKMKMEAMKVFTCPMHPDVTDHKPGKCSKCGMDLIEKKDDHAGHQH